MKILRLHGKNISVRCAPITRKWMDKTPDRFAYRCLPLKIANQYGWEILNENAFTAMWDGSHHKDGIIILPDDKNTQPAFSHFGSGVLTFHVDALFKTDPNVDLFVQGPVNSPKDAIHALSGVVETDWSPMTFTMNWIFTRPNICVRFDRGEPICSFFPLKRGFIESVEPRISNLGSHPSLHREYQKFSKSRSQFNSNIENNVRSDRPWQKHYHNGVSVSGEKISGESHRTKLIIKKFTDE